MGLLIGGKWQDKRYDTKSTGGHFVRKDAAYRNWVTADGLAGPGGAPRFKAEPGRYHHLFETLDWLEEKLSTRRFLTGDWLTEAYIRLFTTLIRFDAVYAGHFKRNLRRMADYPNLSAYTRR